MISDAGQVAESVPGSATDQSSHRRLRIAYLASRFPKITETFVLYEMRAVEELGADVEVFALLRGPAGPRHPEAVAYERRAHYLPFLSPGVLVANLRRVVRDPGCYLRTWWEAVSGTFGSLRFCLGAVLYFPKCVAFAERVERLGIDHIHAHFASHPALAALIIHRLTGVPFSFTAHGSDLHVERRMLSAKVAAASFVVTVSSYNRALIAEECDGSADGKVVVIHCGADSQIFGADDEANEGRLRDGDDDRLRIVCIASLEEVKGHVHLLRACRLLMDRGVRFTCDLLGGGPLRRRLQKLIVDLGLEASVHLHGAVPRPEVRSFLSGAEVGVLASYPTASGRREGIPVALMEAMMSRLAVVASALSGIPELVEHGKTGFLVPPGDPESLADRLECLAAAPQLRSRLGEAGRSKVITEFDQRVGARILLDHIRRTVCASRYRDS